MTYVKINGKPFDVDVAISDLEESFNVLDGPNAGRAMNGGMIRDIIRTYIGHKITFFNGKSNKDFDALWDYTLWPIRSMIMSSWRRQTVSRSISYAAYYTSGTRRIRTVDGGVNYWDELEVSFVPIDAQVKP